MKERPILFSTSMVQAERAGRKDVTRRTTGLDVVTQNPDKWKVYYIGEYWKPEKGKAEDTTWVMFKHVDTEETVAIKCRYGKPGDILWVRETFSVLHYEGVDERPVYLYRADPENEALNGIWKPNIFMPREACRLKLEVVSIRPERLHDITEEDAIREGIEPLNESSAQLAVHGQLYKYYTEHREGIFGTGLRPIESYMTLWESINGKESLDDNPWCWRIEFKRIEP